MFMLFGAGALAQTTVSLAWDPHPQAADLEGFKLYCGKANRAYGGVCATYLGGSLTTGTVVIEKPGNTCMALTAYIADGTESDFSNEVCQVIKPKAPTGLKSTLVQAAAKVVNATVGKIAGLFRGHKNLKITKVS